MTFIKKMICSSGVWLPIARWRCCTRPENHLYLIASTLLLLSHTSWLISGSAILLPWNGGTGELNYLTSQLINYYNQMFPRYNGARGWLKWFSNPYQCHYFVLRGALKYSKWSVLRNCLGTTDLENSGYISMSKFCLFSVYGWTKALHLTWSTLELLMLSRIQDYKIDFRWNQCTALLSKVRLSIWKGLQ